VPGVAVNEDGTVNTPCTESPRGIEYIPVGLIVCRCGPPNWMLDGGACPIETVLYDMASN